MGNYNSRNGKYRILLVGPCSQGSGITTFMNNLSDSYLRQTYNFIKYPTQRPPKQNPFQDGNYQDLLKDGVKRLLIGVIVTFKRFLLFPFYLLSVQPAIVQIHSSDYFSFWESSYYLIVSRFLRFKVIVRFGGIFDSFFLSQPFLVREIIKRILELSHHTIVQSKYSQGFFQQFIPPDRISITNNFISTINDYNMNINRENKICKILFIPGSEAKRKGIEVVIKAIKLLKPHHSRFKVVMVNVNHFIETLVFKNRIDHLVEFRPLLSKSELIEEYKNADIFILPSYQEGFPNSMLEAMATGLPVIVSKISSIPEVITEGENGLFIQPGDPTELARKILLLLDNREKRISIGRNNYEYIREHFSAETVLKPIEKVYADLCK